MPYTGRGDYALHWKGGLCCCKEDGGIKLYFSALFLLPTFHFAPPRTEEEMEDLVHNLRKLSVDRPRCCLYYRDPLGKVMGPFPLRQMLRWYFEKKLLPSLMVSSTPDMSKGILSMSMLVSCARRRYKRRQLRLIKKNLALLEHAHLW